MATPQKLKYDGFVDKFKPKKTTDDCMTPDYIYDVVADYVSEHYGIDKSRFARPFWPGADYESAQYPAGCVVVDNPPFSILAKIIRFYMERDIPFFLFAPYLTCFNALTLKGVTAVICDCSIIYENGANVGTAFLTNLEPGVKARSSPRLFKALKAAQDWARKEKVKKLPKYSYPDNVLTASMLGRMSMHGISYKIAAESCCKIGVLDMQKEKGKSIFGGGLLISEKAAAEKAAAEKAAAEKAAAIKWQLSDREREIIRNLK